MRDCLTEDQLDISRHANAVLTTPAPSRLSIYSRWSPGWSRGASYFSCLPNCTARHTGQSVCSKTSMAIPIRQFRSRHPSHDYDDGGDGEGPNVNDDALDGDKEDRAPTRDDSSPESVASSQGRRETERDERGRHSRNFCESRTQGRYYYFTW
jgi:hypothetical protein